MESERISMQKENIIWTLKKQIQGLKPQLSNPPSLDHQNVKLRTIKNKKAGISSFLVLCFACLRRKK
jgi:hypothetical protein